MSDRLLLVSADGHAGAPAHLYREYLDPEFRETFDEYINATRQMQSTIFSGSAEDRKKFVDDWLAETGDGGELAAWDSDYREKELDADGVAAEVLFPDADASGLGWSTVVGAPFSAGLGSSNATDPGLIFAGSRAHNRWLADFCAASPTRRAGIALVPAVHDVDAAVAEVRWAKDAGITGGIMIPTRWMDKPAYHEPVYDALWSVCEDLDMPVHTHSGAGPGDYGVAPPLAVYTWESWWWAGRPLWVLLLGGVFERHPRLKFALTENASFWVADMRRLLDDTWTGAQHATKKFGLEALQGSLKMKPSEYMDRNCWLGSVLTPNCVARRHEIGVQNLMWGSDFPHPEGSWPHTREWLHDRLGAVPRDELERIVGLNALDIYPFDKAELTKIAARIGPTYEDIAELEAAAG